MLIRILLLIDAPGPRRRILGLLRRPDALVSTSPTPLAFWEALGRESCDLVIASRAVLPQPPESVIPEVRKLPDRPEMIVLVDAENAAERAALQAAGAFAVVDQRLPDAALEETLATLVGRHREARLSYLPGSPGEGQQSYRLHDFASESPAMRELLGLARRVAATDSSLLILGETGAGKEWLARAIHTEGARAGAPFIALNCAAVPETLLESELFGHEKGAFTGAARSRRGYFELAHRGTLFLDEVAEMPLHLQVKLLRVLQDHTIQRLGSEQPVAVDVRIMAATNRDPEEAMAEKSLRRDLYYRLGVLTLTLPPLRERREDIPTLATSYLEQFRQQLRRPVESLSPAALEALARYAWPGNVRELINVMERAVLLCAGSEITLAELPVAISRTLPAALASGATTPADPFAPWLDAPLPEGRRTVLEAFERRYLSRLLDATGGNVGETARRAGIDPRTLYNKMRSYALAKEEFREGSEGGSRRNRGGI